MASTSAPVVLLGSLHWSECGLVGVHVTADEAECMATIIKRFSNGCRIEVPMRDPIICQLIRTALLLRPSGGGWGGSGEGLLSSFCAFGVRVEMGERM